MTVKLITFKTNHTIIGDILEQTDKFIKVKQPVQVVVQPSKEGNLIGFSTFIDFAEEFKTGITLPLDAILVITTPVTELLNQYNSIFGSGIQIANSMPPANDK